MRDKEQIIRLFMYDPTPDNRYFMSYQYRKQSYKADKPIIDAMIKEGTVFIISKNTKTVVFEYIPKNI